MRRPAGGLIALLAAFLLPATVPQTRGYLLVVWLLLAGAGAYWLITSEFVLERAGRALTPYIEQSGDTPAAQTLRAMVAVRNELQQIKAALARGLSDDWGTYPPPADAHHRVMFPTAAWINNGQHLSGLRFLREPCDLASEAYHQVDVINGELRRRISGVPFEAENQILKVDPGDEFLIDPVLTKVHAAARAFEESVQAF